MDVGRLLQQDLSKPSLLSILQALVYSVCGPGSGICHTHYRHSARPQQLKEFYNRNTAAAAGGVGTDAARRRRIFPIVGVD